MGVVYNTSIVRNGLVLHLDAANVKSYPGSGNTWSDLSGNGNHGTLTNGATFDANNSGSIVFDGTNDTVVTSSIISLTDYTFEVFFKPIGPSLSGESSYNTLLGYSGTRRLLCSTGGNLLAQVGTGNIFSSVKCSRNIWNQVAFTYQSVSTTAKWYINGINYGISSAAAQGTWNSVIYIGSYNSDNYWMNGNISSVKIYNRSITDTEVQQNFNALRGRYGI